MADEGSTVMQTPPEFEEIELEELDENSDLTTGQFVRVEATAQSSAGRISAPPPVPPEARERRSTPPGGVIRPPPPPGPATTPPPSNSGMFLIDPAGRMPPLPMATTDSATLRTQLQMLSRELRELRAEHDRLRLTVRLRDDRVRELEKALLEQRARAESLEAKLQQVREQDTGDDLKRIAGIGPGFERALHENGVTTFAQIAAWTLEDVEGIARKLRTAPARIVRGGWVERARELAGISSST
jgi:predicted flap endonuclease-1-like 5' DNA nuclease